MKKTTFLFMLFLLFITACEEEVKEPIITGKEPIQLHGKFADDTTAYEITYDSDGLNISGYLLMPSDLKEEAPVIMFNHGGVLDSGAISKKMLEDLAYWTHNGYIVLASQYRGVGESEGEYAFGDGDVEDVLNLLKAVDEIEHADDENVFMYGVSRGGMVTYQAVKEGADVKAAASVAGISDLVSGYKQAPSSLKYFLYETLGFLDANLSSYKERSAVYWAEKIDVPLLLIHAKQDPVIPVDQTKKLAEKLKLAHKNVKMLLFDSRYHTLTDQTEQYLEEVNNWFSQYKEPK
ncbi:dipeptidyl aminopeptidase/acylaminoacyl peptidase [Salirhabdus euzebyi]|uniref:Dipeptidyl aminopeptidase/acylaminoacyl peptidase n=1 Tax=Salirhabdus euzebyi TaxID=394506 RepID=A0A841Q8R4_9BACI|nr:prolyl oligopeptidase family serine peptidase [Salirhabdus euzebyi]MBB6454786.1 dipeptidyl aminopeptidase/acylaminoacyl peptidase [Salirhabdus euzebyi]